MADSVPESTRQTLDRLYDDPDDRLASLFDLMPEGTEVEATTRVGLPEYRRGGQASLALILGRSRPPPVTPPRRRLLQSRRHSKRRRQFLTQFRTAYP